MHKKRGIVSIVAPIIIIVVVFVGALLIELPQFRTLNEKAIAATGSNLTRTYEYEQCDNPYLMPRLQETEPCSIDAALEKAGFEWSDEIYAYRRNFSADAAGSFVVQAYPGGTWTSGGLITSSVSRDYYTGVTNGKAVCPSSWIYYMSGSRSSLLSSFGSQVSSSLPESLKSSFMIDPSASSASQAVEISQWASGDGTQCVKVGTYITGRYKYAWYIITNEKDVNQTTCICGVITRREFEQIVGVSAEDSTAAQQAATVFSNYLK